MEKFKMSMRLKLSHREVVSPCLCISSTQWMIRLVHECDVNFTDTVQERQIS